MRLLRGLIILLALGPGLFMTFDGSRALIAGDYVTPSTGPYAGQLGPWHHVVEGAGIDPRSTLMKVTFVAFGVAWLLAVTAFVRRAPRSETMLALLALLTLWYLPIGTFVSVAVMVALAIQRARERR